MFRWHEHQPAIARSEARDAAYGVHWAVTDRFGGSSNGRKAEFNLGLGVGDQASSVAANRALLAAEFAVEPESLRFMRQHHGRVIVAVPESGPAHEPDCDAIVTDDPCLALAVLVADCTPVLLLDRVNGWIAAAHAGRVGMSEGVVEDAVTMLRDRGADHLEAVVGPSICGRCYEVPRPLREDAARRSPAAHAVSWSGTPAIDVAAGVVQQLHRHQVAVRWLPGCTRESPDLYSHRDDPQTGRFAAVVRLLAPGGGP